MSVTPNAEAEATALKQTHRELWASGDYGAIATHIERVPPAHLLATVGIEPHHRVLDVATGTGNVAMRAVAAGAEVVGLDLVPGLLAKARERAAAQGLEIRWVEGDAEALPCSDASYDRVLSAFGVQFAPRHERSAAELVRVCKPGGAIGLVSWTPEGLLGQLFAILSRYLPEPPPFASPPPLWGSEEHVAQLFAADAVELEFERATNPFVFESVEGFAAFLEEHYGPTLMARRRLVAAGTWQRCRAELIELFDAHNRAGDGTAHLEGQYLLAVAHKRYI